MAKKSKIAKANKQRELIEKYADLRKELKEAGDYQALAKLPKDANPNHHKNRDMIDGRPRAYMRKFDVCDQAEQTKWHILVPTCGNLTFLALSFVS